MKKNAPTRRDQKISVLLDRALMSSLLDKQQQLTREFGVQVSLSQAAAAALRRGLNDEQARN